ncbi:MAG TPA: thiamine diphosphokinase [Calditrichia bacterium]|nr:thiamine diphosphokinase [Calditrichia bacterium]
MDIPATTRHGLLFLNGEIAPEALEDLDRRGISTILAADGGFHHAMHLGFIPDVVVGDFDSIAPAERDSHPGIEWLHRPDQDMNDFEKALIAAEERGITHLTVLGIAGGRLDHTLTNLSVVARFDRKIHLDIRHGRARIFPVRGSWEFRGEPGQLLSLAPLGEAVGVHTRGLRYPLKGETLAPGIREGLSNVIEDGEVGISLKSGLLLVFLFPPESRESSPA